MHLFQDCSLVGLGKLCETSHVRVCTLVARVVALVALGDEEARRRHTQKSILERKAPPTFGVVVEIVDYYKVTVHPEVTEAVDAFRAGRPIIIV